MKLRNAHAMWTAAALLGTGFVAWLAGSTSIQATALVAASVVAGIPIARKALVALRHRTFSIDLLVTIAVVGALTIGEYVESSVVAFLFLFGAYLEQRSLERTRASIRQLVDVAPTTARLLRDGVEIEVGIDEIREDDLVVVKSGDVVPVDGRIVAGAGHLAQASITGEPVPVERTEGDDVFAGTTLENGFLTVRASKVGADTTFARIIELVEDAQDTKAARQRFLDRFASFYTPTIILASVVFGLVTRNVELALTFLVIACPGALVIATPVAMVAGIGNGARRGVILKGGDAVERLAEVDTLVMDKTGTLTVGRPIVMGLDPLLGSEDDLLRVAASLELASEHPLGRAIVAAGRERELALSTPTEVEVLRGVGLAGTVDGARVIVGSARVLEGYDVSGHILDLAGTWEDDGATVSFVLVDGELLGALAIADDLRPGAADATAALHRGGIRRIVMLTGDNERAARTIARRVGIDEVNAGLLPEDKVTHIQRLSDGGAKVAMVGDGLNDAPALAAAHVGIAMGAGTDVSVETADVVLAGNRLDQLVHAQRLARRTVLVMTQNTTIALVTVVLLLMGVVMQQVGMSLGMLVHEASVLAVTLNALRLTAWHPADFAAATVEAPTARSEKKTVGA